MKHLSKTVRARVIVAAMSEAQRRGDRRLSTEHLVLGLLHEDEAVQALGVDLTAARTALDALDRAALAAIGINTGEFHPTALPAATKRPPLTSAARATLLRAIKPTPKVRATHPTATQFLLALLACEQPDPAAELFTRLGIDRAAVRSRLDSR